MIALRVFIDGSGANLRSQQSRIAIVIQSGSDRTRQIVKDTEGRLTNNLAEYQALIEVLSQPEVKSCPIYADSRLLHGQLTLGWKVKRPHLKEPNRKCASLLKEENCRLEWIRRNENLAGKLLEKRNLKAD